MRYGKCSQTDSFEKIGVLFLIRCMTYIDFQYCDLHSYNLWKISSLPEAVVTLPLAVRPKIAQERNFAVSKKPISLYTPRHTQK